MDPVRHFEADTVAAYAERRLPASERARFEEHLATCASCREELVAICRILVSRRTSRLRTSLHFAAAASVVLLVSVPLIRYGRDDGAGLGPAPHRGSPAPGVEVETVLPQAESEVPWGAPLRFVWRDIGEGGTFRLTLLDEAGNLVWTVDTGDTTAVAPEHLPLERGGTYFWYVDALSPDGRSATSGPRSFRLR